MQSKKLYGGSIGGSIGVWKRTVLAVRHFGALLLSLNVKNIVLKNAFTNIAKSPFGIKVLKEYIYSLLLSLRKVSTHLQKLSSKKATSPHIQLKEVRDVVSEQSLYRLLLKEIETISGREIMLGILVPIPGYKEIMEAQSGVRTEMNRYLDSIVLRSHLHMSGLLKIK